MENYWSEEKLILANHPLLSLLIKSQAYRNVKIEVDNTKLGVWLYRVD